VELQWEQILGQMAENAEKEKGKKQTNIGGKKRERRCIRVVRILFGEISRQDREDKIRKKK